MEKGKSDSGGSGKEKENQKIIKWGKFVGEGSNEVRGRTEEKRKRKSYQPVSK